MNDLEKHKLLENRFKLIKAHDTFNSFFDTIPDVSDYLKAKVMKQLTKPTPSNLSFQVEEEAKKFTERMKWAFNFEAYPYILGVLNVGVSDFDAEEYHNKLIEYYNTQKDQNPNKIPENLKDSKHTRLFEELDPHRENNEINTILTLIAVNRIDTFIADAEANNNFEKVKVKSGELNYKLKNKYYIDVLKLVKEKILVGSLKVKTNMIDSLFRTPSDNIALNLVKYNSIDNIKKYRSSFPQLEQVEKELIAASKTLKDKVLADEKHMIKTSGTSIKDVYILAKYNSNLLMGLQTDVVYDNKQIAETVRDAQPKGTAFKYKVMSLDAYMKAQLELSVSNQVGASPGI